MRKRIEKTYGNALRGVFYAVNPFKKKIVKTHCTVHKFIILQSLEILKNDGYEEEHDFFCKYVKKLNEGVTWADQDFKSSNHFYHIGKERGLYGFSDAMKECEKYYSYADHYLDINEIEKAMFYFGAACHLVQDVNVPQHVNNKLLKSHRAFELWIISRLFSDYSFVAKDKVVLYNTVEDYIKNNAILANSTYLKYYKIENRDERYGAIASDILKEAQRTTAGFMILFYKHINENKILP